MRTIERASSFKRDYKREAKGQHRKTLDELLLSVLSALVNDEELPPNQHDHPLIGGWNDYRECHLKPDLLLIYKKTETGEGAILQLARLGSHSEIFG